MRYYRIDITEADTGAAFASYTSLVNGVNDPGALNVILDIPVAPYAVPVGAAYVQIWGVSLQTLSQASDLNGKKVKVYGGMQKGLPLANPAQAGLLVSGIILQAFGNWIGTNMTLDLVLAPDGGSSTDPKNLVLNWKKGANLSEAITTTLSTAFPGLKQNIDINSSLVLGADEVGYFQSLSQFAQYLKGISQDIVGGNYPGVDVLLREDSITVWDQTTQSDPLQLAFTDLIGQPTWIDPGTIQINTVMRADLSVGDYVKLPPAQVTTTAQSLSQYRNNSVFQGSFIISFMRHVGNFRTPDGTAWITTMNLNPSVPPS